MSSIDASISQLFEVLYKQRSEVEKAEKESKRSWITTCVYKFYSGKTVQLQVLAKESEILEVMADLVLQNQGFEKAALELGMSSNSLINGFTYDDWKQDIQKRLAKLQLQQKKEKLATLEKRLEGIESPEQKRQKELQALQKELGL